MEFRVDKNYMIKGVDLGMLLVAETTEEIREVVERIITRGPIEKPQYEKKDTDTPIPLPNKN